MTRFTAIILAIACIEGGYLLNDAVKWVSGTNYVQTVLEVGE